LTISSSPHYSVDSTSTTTHPLDHPPFTHRYALYLGAVPAENEPAVLQLLLDAIHKGTTECDSTPCVDTGILATKWLMELLSIKGHTDIALDLAFKTDFPSWGYMARQNATTIWEHVSYLLPPWPSHFHFS
jgi:alpha-L-rhamnosidase